MIASQLIALADAHGTPFYLYDLDAIKARFAAVRSAFFEVELLYAMKANPSPAILRALFGVADGIDVSSLGEIEIATAAGWAPSRLSFTGPGKREPEIMRAIELGVGLIAVESAAEIEVLARCARSLSRTASILLRINPPDRIHAFAVPATGPSSPFGIDDEALPNAASAIARHPEHVRFEGLHVHAGSQCRSAGAISFLAERIFERAETLARVFGLRSRMLDFGGGFGVVVRPEERALDLVDLAARLESQRERFTATTGLGPRISFELGRHAVADAGVYVARVVNVKRSYGQRFAVLDGGLNHLLSQSTAFGDPARPRPAIHNLTRPDAAPVPISLVGPLCTPLDQLAKDLLLPEPSPGDLIAFTQAGAYGYTLSPLLFLGHMTPLELVVEGGEARIARERKRIVDLI